MKVLMGAYACVPMWGSEPGAGWYWAEAASQRHEVWILTAEENRHDIEACMDRFPALRERLHPVYVSVAHWARRLGTVGMHLPHYFVWQHAARRVAKQLHEEIGFDVAHHVTWTVSWLPSAVARIPDLPLVWGPVSGSVGVPRSMWRWLGWKGAVKEILREAGLPVMRAVFARAPMRRASVVLAQSEDFARWATPRTSARVVVEPVVALRRDDFALLVNLSRREPCPDGRVAVFAARFSAWKGLLPTIAALARPEAVGWHLRVYGDGSGEEVARKLALRLGLGDRVRFHGRVARRELDEVIAGADAFLHPSFHDAPPFVVAEALCLGCPVVCLDVGGPASLIGEGEGVTVTPTADLPGELARALQSMPPRFEPSSRWHVERLPDRLDQWYAMATGRERAT